MRISIALATYNGAEFLQEQLNSFLHQTRLPDELVACDDASSDDTMEILEAFRKIAPFAVNIYSNRENLGHLRNFEKVLALCAGDLIFLSDQDDVWDKEKIALVVNHFTEQPKVDVVINDAYYVDRSLKRQGLTVLQKVVADFGGQEFHTNGACTALTKRFRNFIVPFPKGACPNHDIYIHRWANFIGNRFVLDVPLQVWRIHGHNATNNQMASPVIESTVQRYLSSRDLAVTSSYQSEACEYLSMRQILDERKDDFSSLPMAPRIDDIRAIIDRGIEAKLNRAKLVNLGWLRRKVLVAEMIAKGQYKYFYGIRSIAKDILR